MNKYELVSKIEKIAPLASQEDWDSSGWIVDDPNVVDVKKIMLALTITESVINQARLKKCDMILSHHPLFCVPLSYRDIQIYASHTPMDKAVGGTTEALIKALGFNNFKKENDFVRVVELNAPITINNFRNILKTVSPNNRLINNLDKQFIKIIGFCSGSGSEFISSVDVDAFVTGDLKYHTAVETDKIVFDIGHFESEIIVLDVFKEILGINEVEYSNEKNPFI